MRIILGIGAAIVLLAVSSFSHATVGLSVSPGVWDVGAVPEGSVQTTWTSTTPVGDGYFTVSHIGTDQWETISIRADNTVNWTLGTVQGENVFTLGWGQTVEEGTLPPFTRIRDTNQVLVESLTAGSEFAFDIRLGLPVPSSTIEQQQITVTLTASTPVGYVYCMSGDFWARNIGAGPWSADWSVEYTHPITEQEWAFMVADGILPIGVNGWTPDLYGSTSAHRFAVTSTTPPEIWHYDIQTVTHAFNRWVILD